MKTNEIIDLIKIQIGLIAPEADLEVLDPDDDIRYELDIDSMDFFRLMVAISEELDIDIPEEDYARLTSLNKLSLFLEERINK